MSRILRGLCWVVLACALHACENNRFKANIADENYNLACNRIDLALFTQKNPLEMGAMLSDMGTQHEEFTQVFLSEIMQVGSGPDSMAALNLSRFVSDTLWQGLQSDVKARYPAFCENEKVEIEQGIKRVKSFFPELIPPKVFAFNSGFNIAIYPSKTFIGVGLEWFLEPENSYVKMLPSQGFPMYKRQGMDQKYLVPDAIKGWLLHNFYEPYYFQKDLLREMVFYGKVMLMLEVALPDTEFKALMKYNSEQAAWAFANQKGVWQQLVAKNLLFSTNAREINRLIQDGPFTSGFSNESSPRLGWYLGWQMVKQYADKTDLSLSEIIKTHNEQEILKKFNPAKTLK